MKHRAFNALIWTVAAHVGLLSFPQIAQAELVGTESVARAEGVAVRPAGDARALLASTLARDEVAARLREQGVDPAQVLARVQALSDDQAQALAQQIDSAPAGAGVLGTIVFIFVLLLVTDILGFTHVYPFTRPIR